MVAPPRSLIPVLLLLPACTGTAPEPGPRHPDPWLGSQRAVVLLLAWSDAPPSLSRDAVDLAFFGPQDSLAAWFAEASGGAFTLTGDVLDWRTAATPWAELGPKEPGRVVRLARQVFDDALAIERWDSQGNGRIDHLFVVHAGRLPVDRIGPKAMFTPARADRSVVLQSQGVGAVGAAPALGFYLHEAGHRWFDLGDQYGDHRHGRYGIGVWGLMGLGQWGPHARIASEDLFRYPVHPRAAAKAQLGWLAPQVVRASTELVLEPVEQGGGAVHVPLADAPDLWLEVRSATGFHRDLPGHGLLVWQEPAEPRGQAVLVQADGRDDLAHGTDLGRRPVPPLDENFGDASDPFPGTAGVQVWTDPVSGVQLSGIHQDAGRVGLQVVLSSP